MVKLTTMNMNEQMQEAEVNILHTYNRFPVVFERERAVIYMIPREKNTWISLPESL